MIKVTGNRASSILYTWLICNQIQGTAIVPANICETVPAAYYKAGLRVTFCDIEPDTFQPSKKEIEKLIIRFGGRCVLHYNHTYGAILEDDDLFLEKIHANYPEVMIVDDRCLCIPEQELAKKDADLYLFSSGKTKVVDLGFGGFAFVSDSWAYHSLTIPYNSMHLENFEMHVKECHKHKQKVSKEVLVANWIETAKPMPENYCSQIRKMQKKSLDHKTQINNIYSALPGAMRPEYQNWRYNILVENQKECLRALFDHDLFASFHYMSLGNGYFDQFQTPNCNWLERHVINLFNDFHYSVNQAKQTVEILKNIAIPVKENSLYGKSNDFGCGTSSGACNKESERTRTLCYCL